MKKSYSAQNVTAFIIYTLKEQSIMIDSAQLQNVLKTIDMKWRKVFGQCAFTEPVNQQSTIYIEEVNRVYTDQFGQGPLEEPAREWFLPYGQFVVQYRPYGIPPYSPFEKLVMERIIADFLQVEWASVS